MKRHHSCSQVLENNLYDAMVLKHQNHLEGLFKHRLLDARPPLSKSGSMGGHGEDGGWVGRWGKELHFLKHFQRMLMLLILGPHFETHHYNRIFIAAKGELQF